MELAIPKHSRKGTCLSAAVFGAASAVLLQVCFKLPGPDRPPFLLFGLTGVLHSLFLILSFGYARRNLLAAFVYWAVGITLITVPTFFTGRSGGAFLLVAPRWWMGNPIGVLVSGGLGVLVHWLTACAARVVAEVVVQDGTICKRCAYSLGTSDRILTCPECGTPREGSQYRLRSLHQFLSGFRARARLAFLVTLASLVVMAVALSGRRFAATFPLMWQFRYGMLVGNESVAVWLDRDDSTVLVIDYEIEPAGGIDLLVMLGHYSPQQMSAGYPRLSWRFSREQTSYLIAEGFPQEFLDEVRDAMSAHNWALTQPLPLPPPVELEAQFRVPVAGG